MHTLFHPLLIFQVFLLPCSIVWIHQDCGLSTNELFFLEELGPRAGGWHLTPRASDGPAITSHNGDVSQCWPLICKGSVVLPMATGKIRTAVFAGLSGGVAARGKIGPARKMKLMSSSFLFWLGLFWELDPVSWLRERSWMVADCRT